MKGRATPETPSATGDWLADAVALGRLHIVLIAMCASVTFGWLMTGRYGLALALVVGFDWFIVNLMNRVTDVAEDLKNAIRGTGLVARHARLVTLLAVGLLAASFVATHLAWPALTPLRVAVQVVGLAYNYRIVPTRRGLSRLKEIYFWKNFGSSILFVLTCFAYPLACGGPRTMSAAAIVTLAVFFVPFELTYEILYDLRDLEGDRAEGVPTYPVVHGPERARQIIDALLVLSSLVLVAGLLARAIGAREGLMLAAPAIQLAFYRPRLRRGLTPRDCIFATHLGSALLVVYLVGTALWLRAGLPWNVFL